MFVFVLFLFFFFFCHSPCGDSIPGKSHTFFLNQKRLPTCATSIAASGCVQSFNHLHFQLKKKKRKKKKEEEYKTQLNSKPGSLSKIGFVLFCFVFKIYIYIYSVFCRVFCFFFFVFLFFVFKYRHIKSMPIYM